MQHREELVGTDPEETLHERLEAHSDSLAAARADGSTRPLTGEPRSVSRMIGIHPPHEFDTGGSRLRASLRKVECA